MEFNKDVLCLLSGEYKKKCWYFVAILRSCTHLVFDRTIEKKTSLFEFFVPTDMEPRFLLFMKEFEQQGIVSNLTKKQNRLVDPHQGVWSVKTHNASINA